ncbi:MULTISPECIES: DeoR/GlpR family DNA-binding transcription regulator [Rhodanobacter]|uniref:DeoR/GlpR family DNA-binding transcription regulator n=1 Tax=Rhodanobacter TaxID=75309 RepID=UPI0003FD115B|nr:MULTISPECIES: DeoR/GlpR family DNA-binding transcription regulator [Rhodanobacter]KZC18660.1 DeoR family transcriptional regulator [Rhodanobacter denitrificans]UJM95112.1 DeoR/GlpR family DNA-binding transcription regulator [Rhodanobacter denitrificans]UJM98643.1 DeoR/GlpR family DNA-binding transcription regulator [Rhodanobacter denitrificans]UJN21942.1 DeoR/GlpR family DNA-binding transcription regulator [Rhodanobacter denitrificans]
MAKPPLPGELLPQERQHEILQRLRSRGRVVAAELAAELAASEDSIRRDLRELAAQGLCRRVYGGALPLSAAVAPLQQRRSEQVGRKLALARKAVSLVREGQVLLIDAGSTNAAIAAALPERMNLTVITNAPDIALALIEREGFEILLLGGRIDPRIGGAVGAQTLQELQRVRADLCFPGACAIDADSGLWGFDSEESLQKRAMIEASGETVVVATSDKLGTVATHRIAPIAEVQYLVVEHAVGRPVRAAFSARGVSVHRAEAAAD